MDFKELIVSSVKDMFTKRMFVLFILLYIMGIILNLNDYLYLFLSNLSQLEQISVSSILSQIVLAINASIFSSSIVIYELSIVFIFLSFLIRASIIRSVSFIKKNRSIDKMMFDILKVSALLITIQSLILSLFIKGNFIHSIFNNFIYVFLTSAQHFQIPSVIFTTINTQFCLLGVGDCFALVQPFIFSFEVIGAILVLMVSIFTIFSYQGILCEDRSVIDSIMNSIIVVKENLVEVLTLWIISCISYLSIIAIGSVLTIILYEINIFLTLVFFIFSTLALQFILILQTKYYVEKQNI